MKNAAYTVLKQDLKSILSDDDSSKDDKFLQILGAISEYEKAKEMA